MTTPEIEKNLVDFMTVAADIKVILRRFVHLFSAVWIRVFHLSSLSISLLV